MKLRRYFLILILIILNFSSISQQILPPSDTEIPKKYVRTNLYLGSQFSSFSKGYGSSFSSYVIPVISWDLNKKYSISAGFGYINTNYSGYKPLWFSEEKIDANTSSGLVFMSGSYLLNNRITVSGSAYKMFDLSGATYNYPGMNRDSKGFDMRVDYKVAEGFHIQAGFGFHENRDPYMSPAGNFMNDPIYSPFNRFP